MKQKNGIIAGVVFAGVVAHLSFASMSNAYSDISLSNIEAIFPEDAKMYCYGTGSVDCPSNVSKAQMVIYF